MANDCWNKVIIRGDEETLKKIHHKFTRNENGIFSINNYKNLFDTDLSDMDEEDWGSKRFIPTSELTDGELLITGDSAWSPMIGLFETICAEYGVEATLEYDEPGNDFAGKVSWNSNGVITESYEWTYWESLLINRPVEFWEEISWRYEDYDDFEDLVESLELNRWNDSMILDVNKLEENWEQSQSEG